MSDSPSTATRPSLWRPRHWPTFAWLAIAMLGARLPWTLQRALGRGVGWLALHLARSRRRAAEVNLALCFLEQDEACRQRSI